MKKTILSAVYLVLVAITVTTVSCTKKEQKLLNETSTINDVSQSNARTEGAVNPGLVPVDPGTPTNPVDILNGGHGWNFCINMTCQETFGYSPCTEDFGVICNWSVTPCDLGEAARANATVYLPDLTNVTTKVVYVAVKLKDTETRDLSGKTLEVANNMQLDRAFCTNAKCTSAYLLKSKYVYGKGNIVTLPVYIVGHTN